MQRLLANLLNSDRSLRQQGWHAGYDQRQLMPKHYWSLSPRKQDVYRRGYREGCNERNIGCEVLNDLRRKSRLG